MVTMSIIPAESIGAIEKQKEANIGLLREMIVNGRRLNDEQITGRAAFAALYGLNPVDEVNTITNAQGQTMAHSMHINGFRRKCEEQVNRELPGAHIDLEFVEFAKDKLPVGAAYGYECRLRDGSSQDAWTRNMTKIGKLLREVLGPNLTYKDLTEACGPSPIYTGIGIVWTRELSDYKDANYNPMERAKKRAERNARGRRFTINAPIYDGDAGPLAFDQPNSIDGEFKEAGESRSDGTAETGKGSFKRPENVILTDLGFSPAGYTREDYDRELKEAKAQAETDARSASLDAWNSAQAKTAAEVAPDAPAGLDGQGNPAPEGAETDSAPDGFIDGEGIKLTLEELWPTNTKVSWEMAQTVKGSKGELYVDLTKEDLSYRVNVMEKALKNPDITEAYRSETRLKLDTAKILISLK